MTISMHTIRASIAVPGGAELPITSARITLDEGWSPYVQGSLTLPLTDAALLDKIDPREDVRARVTVQQRFGASGPVSELSSRFGGSVSAITSTFAGRIAALSADGFTPWNSFGQRASTTRTFDLGVRRRAIRYGVQRVEIPLSSDEALLQDYALVATAPLRLGTTSVREVVAFVLGKINRHLSVEGGDATINPDAAVWYPGVTAWAFLSPLVQAGALRLWCDEARHFYLTGDEQTPAAGAIVLSSTGTVTDASDVIDRDGEWYDAVVITYRWKDALGVEQVAYDTADSDNFSKVRAIEYTDTPYPGPGAAKRVLKRAQGRGRVLDVEAVSDYSVTPGQAATVNIEGSPSQTGYVGSVEWSWPGDEMRVTTRGLIDTPTDSWLNIPESVTWNDISVDTTWNTLNPEGLSHG